MTDDMDKLDALAERYMQGVNALVLTMAPRTDMTPEQKLEHAETEMISRMLLPGVLEPGSPAISGEMAALIQARAWQIERERTALAQMPTPSGQTN